MLAALTALFLVAFFALRARSPFRATEAEREPARAIAAAAGLGLADVFALRDLVGTGASHEAWRAAAVEFARLRERLGDPLAAVAVAGGRAAAEQARAAAADADAAWQHFRVDPRAVPGLRFLSVRERFAQRIAARD